MKKLLATFPLIALLAACASPIVAPVTEKVKQNNDDAKVLMMQAQRGTGPVGQQRASSVEYASGMYIPTTKAPDPTKRVLAKDYAQRRVTINRDIRTLADVAERVTTLLGVPVVIAPDAAAPAKGAGAQNQAVQAPMPTPMGGQIGLPGTGLSPMPLVGANYGQSQFNLQYDGPLKGFLDVIAARFNVSYEFSGSIIHIFKTTTRTFHIVAVPGDTTLQNSITSSSGTAGSTGGASGGAGSAGGASSGAGTSGGSSSTTGVSFNGLSVWTALSESIKSMLSPIGTVAVTSATGTVTVTDTPEILDRVAAYIDGQNESLAKQVVVNVRVLSVDLTDGDEYGINWDLLHSSLSGKLGIGLANSFAANANASTLALKVVGGANASVSAWQGSKAIISALSEQGHVSVVTSASLTTSNNQPAPLRVGTQESFLQSSGTTNTANVGSTSTLTPGLITTGFSMSVVPNIMERNRLMLQYAINISSLLGIASVSSGGSTIQTPKIDTRDFLQRVMLNSGDTIVMTGFEQSTLNSSAQGVGSANNFALGGGTKANRKRSILVILIQPIVGEI